MARLHAFTGTVLCPARMSLGEGPSYDAAEDRAYWFDILGKALHALSLGTGEKQVYPLPMMASVLARIDEQRQLIATESGLFIRDRASGSLSLHVAIEAERAETRSNDGRVHPSGALWIGTMGKALEPGAGSLYHVAKGKVTVLYTGLSIPNGICFSPDGATGYFVDTGDNLYKRVALDPQTGLPVGKPDVIIDASGLEGGMDGAVCDAAGDLWNAHWGMGRVNRYSPDGALIEAFAVPGRQSSCPAFIGRALDRMLVTTAAIGLPQGDEAEGRTYQLGIKVNGQESPDYRL